MRFSFTLPGTSVALLGLALSACGGEHPASVSGSGESPSFTVSIVAGDHQEGIAGQLLTGPLVVQVTDEEARVVETEEVRWTADPDSGGLSSRLTTTDGEGLASVRFRPTVAGVNRVVAEVEGPDGPASRVTFELAVWPALTDSPSIYERERYSDSQREAHGLYRERYLIRDDSTFTFQQISGRDGFRDLVGTYSRSDADIEFDYPGGWHASGTFSPDGTCVEVEYNIDMALSGFVGGEYCRSSSATYATSSPGRPRGIEAGSLSLKAAAWRSPG